MDQLPNRAIQENVLHYFLCERKYLLISAASAGQILRYQLP